MARSVVMSTIPIWGFGVALMIFAAVMAVSKTVATEESAESRGWSTAPGTITSSQLGSVHIAGRGGGRTEWSADVSYQYVVDGQTFTGHRVNFDDARNTDRDGMAALVSRYPAGQTVTVHYNPSDPTSTVLDVSPPASRWKRKAIGVGSVGGVIVLIGLAASRAISRRRARSG
jgi:hypothetical protein